MIDQVFLRERQRFHNRSCLVLGFRVDHENNPFAIAARIPPAEISSPYPFDSVCLFDPIHP